MKSFQIPSASPLNKANLQTLQENDLVCLHSSARYHLSSVFPNIPAFLTSSLPNRPNNEDGRIPEHVRDEHRDQPPRGPIRTAPEESTGEGSHDEDGIAGG
jgi:hypothetical protein